MSQGKKFGTFAGVFTPSILTILGVIMYMRLSWIVGNAGLGLAIGIVLIAHVVSISTGLSVSSVATDRKIKAGGIYYMLSRSLGLPIGGSIGITLFVATALSIALYLIGFAESALVVLQEPLGLQDVGINHIRLFGSIALFLIVTIAYISTSIAIKSQFFILGAIILSVLSILFGTQEGKVFDISRAGEIESSFFVLFGIFFPAVTGFTTGVAMSGDLKDPKKSIPWGTMLAVGVGLLVYVGLAFFIYYSIDLDILISDKNALIKFGFVPVLVIAGIWGATLSSALGGILGAPRILQAMSVDSITPKLFAKGKGEDNEPRNALILTFVIAQAGILIGELDVIAEVVAMFYLSAYLFINVSCFLEQWASPDFRPSFKIPLPVSLIGAIVTFVLMIQLNLLAAVVAILVMMLIFIWLTRKQLVLGSGDVWQSVWSSIVKVGLKNLDKKSTHKRNWNPNILLFSGGTDTRTKLVEFSKTVAGAKGMISNFDLIENKTAQVLFPKHKQSIKDEELFSQGIFARKQECKDVYEGIEVISSTYGFSGVEPNTILMSWEQSSDEPARFAKLTNKLCQLDYNVLYLDYDQQRGFGRKKSIDIWWNDFSNTTELTLNLAKFMNTSMDWRHAAIRVLYVNDNNDNKAQLEEVIDELLANYRISAKSKIINNEIENKELYEIMKVESYQSDLVIVGIPDELENESDFVSKTDELVGILGTTLLVRASSHFEETEVVLTKETEIGLSPLKEEEEEELELSQDFYAYPFLHNLFVFNSRNTAHLTETIFSKIFGKYQFLLNEMERLLIENGENLSKQFSSNKEQNKEVLNRSFIEYVQGMSQHLHHYNSEFLPKVENSFYAGIENLLVQNETYLARLPKRLKRTLMEDELVILTTDSRAEKRAKKWVSFKKKRLGLSPKRSVNYQENVTYYYQNFYLKTWMNTLMKSGIFVYQNTTLINQVADQIKNNYSQLRQEQNISKEGVQKMIESISVEIEKQRTQLVRNYKELTIHLNKMNRDYVYSLSKKLELLSINAEVEEAIEEKGTSQFKKQIKELKAYPAFFTRNNKLIHNAILLDISLHEIHPEIDSVIHDTISSINRLSIKPELVKVKQLKEIDKSLVLNDGLTKMELIRYLNRLPLFSFDIEGLINTTIRKVEKIVYKLKSSLEIMDVDSINNLNEEQQSGVKTNTIQLQRLILFSVENKLIKALNSETDTLEKNLNELITVFKNKTLTIETIDFEKEQETAQEMRSELLKSSVKLEDDIETRFKHYISKINEELEETYNLLDYDFIAGNSAVINQYINKTGVATSRFKRVFNQTKREIKKRISQTLSLVDQQRDEYLATEYKLKNKGIENLSSVVSGFVEKVKMSKSTKEELPFFYKKLFLGGHSSSIKIDHREEEIDQANKAIRLLNRKSGGAILVVGEQLAGKKYFADYMASRMLKRTVITIDPIIENRTNSLSFSKTISNAFGNELSLEDNLNQQKACTLVFNNIEKWGVNIEVVLYIKQAVENYGKKHHFILTSSTPYYKYQQPITQLDDCIISTILLLPVRKEGFVETLKLKHQAGGMKFVLNGKREVDLTHRKEDFLYQKYHSVYKGNLGRAFSGWVNNIGSVEGNEFTMKEPKNFFFPDISNPEWIVLLKTLILYKEVSKKDLTALFSNNFNFISVLNQMKRIRLVQETKSNVFELSDEVYFAVRQYLKDKKII